MVCHTAFLALSFVLWLMMYDTGAIEMTESISTSTMASKCKPRYRFASLVLKGRKMTVANDTDITSRAVSACTTPLPFLSS